MYFIVFRQASVGFSVGKPNINHAKSRIINSTRRRNLLSVIKQTSNDSRPTCLDPISGSMQEPIGGRVKALRGRSYWLFSAS
jgi:hypothetical protein